MSNFWQFRNISEEEGELLLYGNIASAKPWWSDSAEGIYPRQFSDDLKALGNIKNLTVRLNSNGGDVFAATAIYTQLKSHAANVTAIIDGVAASAATIILAAADTVKAPSNALLMIHDPLLMLYGYYNAEDMDKMQSVLETVKESILNAYVNKTNRERGELSDMMKNETWMTAEEAKDEGFVDEIMFDKTIDATITNDSRFMVVNSVLHDMSRFETRPKLEQRGSNPAVPFIPLLNKSQQMKKESEQALEIKNLEDLKQAYPDLCNQLATESVTAAAEAERNRIKAIDDISATVDPVLVAKAKFETPITAQELAFESLKPDAGKGRQFLNNRDTELENNDDVGGGTPPEGSDKVKNAADVEAIAAAMNKKRNGVEAK